MEADRATALLDQGVGKSKSEACGTVGGQKRKELLVWREAERGAGCGLGPFGKGGGGCCNKGGVCGGTH